MDSCSGTRKARLGIDLGGTKIEGIVLVDGGIEAARRRIVAPRGDYDATLQALIELKSGLERNGSPKAIGSHTQGSYAMKTMMRW